MIGYWLTVVRFSIGAVLVILERAAQLAGLVLTGRRQRFGEVALERGVVRPDLVGVMFGAYGDREPSAAIEAATEERQAAAAAGFATGDVGLFRRRMQALNTLRAAVDLGLIPESHLHGLMRPEGDRAG